MACVTVHRVPTVTITRSDITTAVNIWCISFVRCQVKKINSRTTLICMEAYSVRQRSRSLLLQLGSGEEPFANFMFVVIFYFCHIVLFTSIIIVFIFTILMAVHNYLAWGRGDIFTYFAAWQTVRQRMKRFSYLPWGLISLYCEQRYHTIYTRKWNITCLLKIVDIMSQPEWLLLSKCPYLIERLTLIQIKNKSYMIFYRIAQQNKTNC